MAKTHNHDGRTLWSDMRIVTPSDSADLLNAPCNGLRVNGAGNVVLVTELGTEITYPALAGEFIPCRVRRVKATGTAAGCLPIIAGY